MNIYFYPKPISMLSLTNRLRRGINHSIEDLFKTQNNSVVGKSGIILAELGMPEDYDPWFYIMFMRHVFKYSLPFFLHPIVLADRGIALIDPNNPLAKEPFTPLQLVDMFGSMTNAEGRKYTDCEFKWRPPAMKRNPWDNGYFLYKGNGKGGAPVICQKTAAKVAGWYFGYLLPEKKVPWAYQCGRVYCEAAASLKSLFPLSEIRYARYLYEDSLRKAVDELLSAGCDTIIYQSFCSPVYSDFEHYSFSMPIVKRLVQGRAKVIFADQPGNQNSMRQAFLEIVNDQIRRIPQNARVLLILSRHGHPFKRDTMDVRGILYRQPLESGMRGLMEEWGGKYDIVWSDDEYADEYWNRKGDKLETRAAYLKAIEEGYDFAIEVPTDFIAENTDLMIFHAMKKFIAFKEYSPFEPIPYPDWDQPLVRIHREAKTTGIYTGCPVGPYRRHVVEAIVNSISDIFNGSQFCNQLP